MSDVLCANSAVAQPDAAHHSHTCDIYGHVSPDVARRAIDVLGDQARVA